MLKTSVLALLAGWTVLTAAAFASAPALAACTDPASPGVDWQRCMMDERLLAGIDITGAKLRDARLTRSDLSGSVLDKVDGRRAKFNTAKLVGASFQGARLIEADFTKADLTGASFKGADLRRARLFRANLRDADLTDARMQGADLLKADLSGATWTNGEHVCKEGSIGQCK